MTDWYGNRHNETYTYRRVAWDTWQEHETYDYITAGSIELSTESDQKVTGTFDFEGYVLPDVNDLIRVYYSYTDDAGDVASVPLATFLVSYADLTCSDTLSGIKAQGTLEGASVLSVLSEAKTGVPKTIPRGANAVYEAEQMIRSAGLLTDTEVSAYSLSTDHTFSAGVSTLEMVNWLLKAAGYLEAHPDAEGKVRLRPATSTALQGPVHFANDDNSIMYPQILRTNDWQNTPNTVRLIYNTDDACIAAYAQNDTGSRASLDARGGREITYFEEVAELSGVSLAQTLKDMAETSLQELSCDIEYVKFEHAYVPLSIYEPVQVNYADLSWEGTADNIQISLSPATKTQTRIKRVLHENIEISSGATVYR